MANPEYLSIKFDESGLPWRNLIGWEYEECEERAPGYELEQTLETGDGSRLGCAHEVACSRTRRSDSTRTSGKFSEPAELLGACLSAASQPPLSSEMRTLLPSRYREDPLHRRLL